MRDEEVMQRAIAVGETARRDSAPNPWVGCVLVRDGELVAEGASRPPGDRHAEVVALAAAGERARGATAYLTLEPCAHHGRTGPCTEALVEAGVSRVVAAVRDPDTAVAGRGCARLRDAGIDVIEGVGATEAERSLAPYLHHRRTGRSFCLAKSAASMDGRVAAADGSSRWITGTEARVDVHELRADSQAIVVGAGTALADLPRLTVRDVTPPPQPPLRVLLDARGRVPARGPLFDPDLSPVLVCTTDAADPATVDTWAAAGAKVATVPAVPGGVDLAAVLELLAGLGVLQAMFEGGPTLLGALVAGALVDRMVVYLAPLVLGAGGLPMLGSWRVPRLEDAARFDLVATTRLGADVRMDLEPV